MESPPKELTAASQSRQCCLAVFCRTQRNGEWGAGSRQVGDWLRSFGSLAVQAAPAGKRDPAEREMNRMLCHPKCGSAPNLHKTTFSESSAPLAQPAHG